MFDDLRQQSDDANFDQPKDEGGTPVHLPPPPERLFLGMTAPQRFIIALMLLIMVCLLGSFCLLLTQKVVPPFLSF